MSMIAGTPWRPKSQDSPMSMELNPTETCVRIQCGNESTFYIPHDDTEKAPKFKEEFPPGTTACFDYFTRDAGHVWTNWFRHGGYQTLTPVGDSPLKRHESMMDTALCICRAAEEWGADELLEIAQVKFKQSAQYTKVLPLIHIVDRIIDHCPPKLEWVSQYMHERTRRWTITLVPDDMPEIERLLDQYDVCGSLCRILLCDGAKPFLEWREQNPNEVLKLQADDESGELIIACDEIASDGTYQWRTPKMMTSCCRDCQAYREPRFDCWCQLEQRKLNEEVHRSSPLPEPSVNESDEEWGSLGLPDIPSSRERSPKD